jgi:hypothetical protein
MHIPIHIMSGWCVASCFKLTPRERLFCMIAATAPDLDGLRAIVGTSSDAYQNWHHLLCHNLLFVVIAASLLAIFSTHRTKAFMLYVLLGHLHLLMDYFGSGPGWAIAYWWPFSAEKYKTDFAWDFFSWQNITTAALLLVWVILVAIRQGHTPLELITPDLNRRIVARLKGRLA